jgi:hypothetical protein
VDDVPTEPRPALPEPAPPARGGPRRALDWCFRDRRTGGITIAQFPNVALWLVLATVVLRRVVPSGTPRTAVDVLGVAALAWWALDEVVRGVNPWRRLLGVLGCVAAAGGLVALLR